MLLQVDGEPAGWHLSYGADGCAPLEVDPWGGWWASFTGPGVSAEAYAERLEGVIESLAQQVELVEPRVNWEARTYN